MTRGGQEGVRYRKIGPSRHLERQFLGRAEGNAAGHLQGAATPDGNSRVDARPLIGETPLGLDVERRQAGLTGLCRGKARYIDAVVSSRACHRSTDGRVAVDRAGKAEVGHHDVGDLKRQAADIDGEVEPVGDRAGDRDAALVRRNHKIG